MPVFRVQVFYQRGLNEKWTNVYHVQGTDLLDVSGAVVGDMEPHLLALLDSSCTLVKYLISDPATGDFQDVPRNSTGTSTASGDLLPLFNSMKAFFQPNNLGRPDYKYYKGFVTESIQTSGNLLSGTINTVDTILTDMLADMTTAGTPLVSEDGATWSAPSVQTAVQMRQMHRRRRRTTPTP